MNSNLVSQEEFPLQELKAIQLTAKKQGSGNWDVFIMSDFDQPKKSAIKISRISDGKKSGLIQTIFDLSMSKLSNYFLKTEYVTLLDNSQIVCQMELAQKNLVDDIILRKNRKDMYSNRDIAKVINMIIEAGNTL